VRDIGAPVEGGSGEGKVPGAGLTVKVGRDVAALTQ
jgi:hypothetical protein